MEINAVRPPLLDEVESRFGLVPNFFQSAGAAPEIIEKLWDFACAAYLDNPIPSLFKERLFVYLSRFCDVRYCILRHCAFLLGHGHAAGDTRAPSQSIEQVIRLLTLPTPWQLDMAEICGNVMALAGVSLWPEAGSAAEGWIIAAASQVFVDPAGAERARESLRHAFGARPFEHLMGLLTFIRAAHYWTRLHPDIEPEEDVGEMLRRSEDLRKLLLEDPAACRGDMGARLFAEFEALRDLHERQALEKTNRELARQAEEKEILLGEIHHRVKNSLQIVSSVLHMQLGEVKDAAAAELLRSSEARVRAIAAVHESLYRQSDLHTIEFDNYLRGLCEDVARTYGEPDCIVVDTLPVAVSRDQAVSIALIVNELVTNAFRHAGPPCRVQLHGDTAGELRITVSDGGSGPPDQPKSGLGTRIITSLSRQIDAKLDACADATGYRCTLSVPLRPEASAAGASGRPPNGGQAAG